MGTLHVFKRGIQEMIKLKHLVIAGMIALSSCTGTPAFAKGGSFSTSMGRSSPSFSRSYSSPRPAPVVRPAPAPVIRNVTVNRTTVVHSGGGFGGNGLLTGMLIGGALNHPAPVVVAPAYAAPQEVVQAPVAPAVIQAPAPEESHWFLWAFFWIVTLSGFGFLYHIWKDKK